MSREVMQQALKALEKCRDWPGAYDECSLALHELRAALAEPEQEPVAWMKVENFIDAEGLWDERVTLNHDGDGKPLYTAPTPQPDTDCHLQGICQRSGYSIAPTPRRPLSDEEIKAALVSTDPETKRLPPGFRDFARAIERAHGIGEQT